ncbi:hypothetical protein [Myxococcus sp. Y35]|uniref:hypothetical protein n=1 Tax=Pseudomyxococcus flavus TaxID=3115648 RepID=UPI003CEC38EA
MTKNIINTALVILGSGALLTGCDFDQPETECFVQGSQNWAVKYEQVTAPTNQAGESCELDVPRAELLGVYKYVDPETGISQLALRPDTLAAYAEEDEASESTDQTALGQLGEQDEQDFCTATNFNEAFVNDVETGNVIRYAFSNVSVYSAAVAPGTQITGEFTYTSNGCTGTYVMSGLWPATECHTNAQDPADACGEGSGMNPELAVECHALNPDDEEDPTYGFCVPAKTVPSFK